MLEQFFIPVTRMLILLLIYHSVCQSADLLTMGEMKHDDFVDSWPLENDRASSSDVDVLGRYHSSDEEDEKDSTVGHACGNSSICFYCQVWSTWTKLERKWYRVVVVLIFRLRFPKKQSDFVDMLTLQNDQASSSSGETQGSAECSRLIYNFAITENRHYQYEHWSFK